MDGSLLDAGIFDIVWFLVKVLIAVLVIYMVLAMLGGLLDTDLGSFIFGIFLFISFFTGVYFVIAWIASAVSGGDGYVFANWVFGSFVSILLFGYLFSVLKKIKLRYIFVSIFTFILFPWYLIAMTEAEKMNDDFAFLSWAGVFFGTIIYLYNATINKTLTVTEDNPYIVKRTYSEKDKENTSIANNIYEAEDKVKRGEVLTQDDLDVLDADPYRATIILRKNGENMKKKGIQ
jgi:hypothetical protein